MNEVVFFCDGDIFDTIMSLLSLSRLPGSSLEAPLAAPMQESQLGFWHPHTLEYFFPQMCWQSRSDTQGNSKVEEWGRSPTALSAHFFGARSLNVSQSSDQLYS